MTETEHNFDDHELNMLDDSLTVYVTASADIHGAGSMVRRHIEKAVLQYVATFPIEKSRSMLQDGLCVGAAHVGELVYKVSDMLGLSSLSFRKPNLREIEHCTQRGQRLAVANDQHYCNLFCTLFKQERLSFDQARVQPQVAWGYTGCTALAFIYLSWA